MAILPDRTELTTPADGDLYVTTDVSDTTDAATGTDKKITWANIKTALATVFAPALGADGNYVTDAEKAALHAAVTVADSSEIDLTLTGQQISASIVAGSIDETKLDTSVNASLDLADSAVQPAGLSGYFQTANIDDTPVNGETAAPISSNWAYDHENSATAHGATGAVVGTTNTQTLTNKRVTPRTGTTTSSATPTINTDNVDFYSLTAQTVDITSFTTNLSGTPTEGQKLWIAITGTAARAITWGASFENGPVALPTTTVTTTRLDVGFIWNSVTSKWRCVASGSTV